MSKVAYKGIPLATKDNARRQCTWRSCMSGSPLQQNKLLENFAPDAHVCQGPTVMGFTFMGI